MLKLTIAVFWNCTLFLSPGGEYCEGTGLAAPTGKCTQGYYCSAASPVAAPAPGSAYGGMCTRGYFCPEGSIAPQNCTPGYCCSQDTLSAPFSECDPGYYCTGLAILPNPLDGTTGNALCCSPVSGFFMEWKVKFWLISYVRLFPCLRCDYIWCYFIRYIVMTIWILKMSQLFKNIQYKTISTPFKNIQCSNTVIMEYDLCVFRLEIILSKTIPCPELIVDVFMVYSYLFEVIPFN